MAPRPDAVYPWWLERQLDVSSPDFLPGGGGEPPVNLARREWLVVGALGVPERSTVDPRGLLTPIEGGYSLDWWVGAAERWRLPSREAAVRQTLLGDTPVVETRLRVPGGDIVHRAFGATLAGGAPVVVVEVENASAHAVALALVVRPWGPTGPASLRRVTVRGPVVEVDDRPALVVGRAPVSVVVGGAADGGVLGGVTGVDRPERYDGHTAVTVDCPAGRAEAAVIVPLPHTAVVRAVAPLGEATRRGRGRRASDAPTVGTAPSAQQVAAGWQRQTDRGCRLELPDPRMAAMVDANRRHLLLVHAGEDLAAVPTAPFDYTEAAVVLEALVGMGFVDEAAQVLATWTERQALDGRLLGDDRRWDGNGGALVALDRAWDLTRDPAVEAAQIGMVANAARWIARRRLSRRGRRNDGTDLPGRMPVGAGPAWMGATAAAFRTDWWSVAGLRCAARMLTRSGETAAADEVRSEAESYASLLAAAVADGADGLDGVVPGATGRGVDGSIVAVVDAVLLGVLAPDAPEVTATLSAVRDRFVHRGAVVHDAGALGLSPRLTARVCRVELRRGERTALERFGWLASSASPGWSWPETVHPRTGGGTAAGPGGAGHDAVATAEVLLAVRDLLAVEADDGLALCPVLPDGWWGQPWSVADLPTSWGMLGYAVRWHGDRPALLWELTPWADVGAIHLRAPGLDAHWSTDDCSGEVLLSPIDPPVQPEGGPGGSDGAASRGLVGSSALSEVPVALPSSPLERSDEKRPPGGRPE